MAITEHSQLPKVRTIRNTASDIVGAFTVNVPIECFNGSEVEEIMRLTSRERALILMGRVVDTSYLNRMRRLYVVTLHLLLDQPNEVWTFTKILHTLGLDYRTTVDVLFGLLAMGNISEQKIGRNKLTRIEDAYYVAIKDTISFGNIDWQDLDLGPYLHSEATSIDDFVKMRRLRTYSEQHTANTTKHLHKETKVSAQKGERAVGAPVSRSRTIFDPFMPEIPDEVKK